MTDIPPHIRRNIDRVAQNVSERLWAAMTPWQKLRAILRSFFR